VLNKTGPPHPLNTGHSQLHVHRPYHISRPVLRLNCRVYCNGITLDLSSNTETTSSLRILSLTQKPTRSLNYLVHATLENMNMVLYLVHASRLLNNLGWTFQISETCYKKCPQHSSSVIAVLALIHLADCWPHALAATHLLCTDASRFHMFITSLLCPNITMQLQTNPYCNFFTRS
jgi:hypothetical protein